jgi:hypothetical protein
MVALDASRRNLPVPRLALWSLGAGIVATVGANLAHGLGHSALGRLVVWSSGRLVDGVAESHLDPWTAADTFFENALAGSSGPTVDDPASAAMTS